MQVSSDLVKKTIGSGILTTANIIIQTSSSAGCYLERETWWITFPWLSIMESVRAFGVAVTTENPGTPLQNTVPSVALTSGREREPDVLTT